MATSSTTVVGLSEGIAVNHSDVVTLNVAVPEHRDISALQESFATISDGSPVSGTGESVSSISDVNEVGAHHNDSTFSTPWTIVESVSRSQFAASELLWHILILFLHLHLFIVIEGLLLFHWHKVIGGNFHYAK